MSINALPAATFSNAVILHNAANVCSEILTRPLLIIMRRIPMRLWRALILNWRVLNLAALWCNLQYLARMAHCLRRIFRRKSLILFLANATIHLHSACCLARNLAIIRYRLSLRNLEIFRARASLLLANNRNLCILRLALIRRILLALLFVRSMRARLLAACSQ